MSAKTPTKEFTFSLPRLPVFSPGSAFLVALLAGTLYSQILIHGNTHYLTEPLPRARPNGKLTALTLSFSSTYDQQLIEHNCVLISQTTHEFLIYTDDLSRPHCSVCKCIPFKPEKVPCPYTAKKACRLRQKLSFLIARAKELREFVFLDSDLVILHKDFLDRLQTRSQDFDFLASYGFMNSCNNRYYQPFNSGLFFLRQLEGLNYSEMMGLMQREEFDNDQNAISKFVTEKYRDWDTLSLKWHCRFLGQKARRGRAVADISLRDCYTLHGRGEMFFRRLGAANRTLMTLSEK